MNITTNHDHGDEHTERIPGTDWAVVRDTTGRILHIYLFSSDDLDHTRVYEHGDAGEREEE